MIAALRRLRLVYVLILMLVTFGLWFVTSSCSYDSFSPALANIFVGNYEKKLFSQTQKPPSFFRYVDNTFDIFDHEAEADEFLTKLICLHPFLKFTFEKEKDKCLPFLDVYVKRTDIGLETSVYRKLTFTGQYVGSLLVLSKVKQV